jgi:EmrB/QacA subfamily drug resistance transporter
VGTVCVGAFLGQLDASIATLVLPTLEGVFHAPVASIEWVALAYLLTLAALVVPFGRLADLVGRKMLYTMGFIVFILGSGLCGLAPAVPWLIAFRVVQAVGAAMLQANSVAIIAAAARPRELGRAIGVQGAAQAVGLAVGPSVGGLLIAHLGWQWVFFIAVPFGVLGATLGWLVLPVTETQVRRPAARERFDWAGAALLGPAIAAALVALSYGGIWGGASPALLGTVALSAALLGLFLLVERQSPSPLVDFSLFRVRLFAAALGAGLLSYAVLFGSLFLLPFALERVLGYDPGEAGLLLTPVPLALGIVAPVGGLLADRIGSRVPTVVGMLVAAVALGGLALAPIAPLPLLVALLVLLGAGVGFFTPANNSAIMASAPAHRRGVAAGLLNMTRGLGTSLGVAGTGAVLAVSLAVRTGDAVERTLDVPLVVLLPAIQTAFLILAILACLTAGISAVRGGRVVLKQADTMRSRVPPSPARMVHDTHVVAGRAARRHR